MAAELSYRFVEEPIRHGSLGRWYRSLRNATGEDRSLMWQRTILTCSIAIVTVLVAGVGLASAQSPRIESGLAFLDPAVDHDHHRDHAGDDAAADRPRRRPRPRRPCRRPRRR